MVSPLQSFPAVAQRITAFECRLGRFTEVDSRSSEHVPPQTSCEPFHRCSSARAFIFHRLGCEPVTTNETEDVSTDGVRRLYSNSARRMNSCSVGRRAWATMY